MFKAILFLAWVFFAFSFLLWTLPPAKASGGVNGDWNVSFTIAGQSADGNISLDVNGKSLTGTVFTEHTGKGTITDGTFENNKLSCTVKFEKHESIELSGEYKEDKLTGTFATEGMTGTWTATKKK